MHRLTEAQRIQQEQEEQALAFFEATLAPLPDPRTAQGQRYPLRAVIVIALMAMVCGCDDAQAMEYWGEANTAWLAGFLDMPHGPPTQDVFLRVFAALDPEAFTAVFRAWVALLRLRLEIQENNSAVPQDKNNAAPQGKHIAVDGKTSRGSFDSGSGKKAIHTVSAWMSDVGLVIGQRQTEEKSNEITAIPELLRLLDIRGATVTIDAMGCQTEITKGIIEGGGNYLICAKENQPTLRQDIEKTFAEADDARRRSRDELARPDVEVFEQNDKGHGRVETRRVRLCRDLNWLTAAERWQGLSFIAEVMREVTTLATGKTSSEKSYYIGSDKQATAESAGAKIRAHWGVESKLHWVLDIAFREDDARHRAQNTAANLATLRHFALNIIRQDPDRKLGIANSRKRAGWDRSYLIKLLTNAEAA
jgi:predicted transposase YbfD/YdcC